MIPPVAQTGGAGTAGATAASERRADPELERATLGFERVLLTQLLQPLAESAGESAPAAYKDMLPQALAEAVTSGDGIGLADELQRALLEDAA